MKICEGDANQYWQAHWNVSLESIDKSVLDQIDWEEYPPMCVNTSTADYMLKELNVGCHSDRQCASTFNKWAHDFYQNPGQYCEVGG